MSHLVHAWERVHDDSILPQDLHRLLVNDIFPASRLIVLGPILRMTMPCGVERLPHKACLLHYWSMQTPISEHLEALLLDAGLVEHIYIPCNLGQVIHLFPFDIATCQKFLDVGLQSRSGTLAQSHAAVSCSVGRHGLKG